MQFHPVESRLQRIAGGLGVGADDVADLVDLECARGGMLDHFANAGLGAEALRIDEYLDAFRHQRRGRHG
ncbi:hypothetical protein D9M69_561600 [compost metagenome]